MASLLRFCLVLAILQPTTARMREYFIGAVDVKWDYAPSGLNMKTGVKIDNDEYVRESFDY